jgi:hypothetical protein
MPLPLSEGGHYIKRKQALALGASYLSLIHFPGAKTFSQDIFQILRVLAPDLVPPVRKQLVP